MSTSMDIETAWKLFAAHPEAVISHAAGLYEDRAITAAELDAITFYFHVRERAGHVLQ
jgi:hypothetical protein